MWHKHHIIIISSRPPSVDFTSSSSQPMMMQFFLGVTPRVFVAVFVRLAFCRRKRRPLEGGGERERALPLSSRSLDVPGSSQIGLSVSPASYFCCCGFHEHSEYTRCTGITVRVHFHAKV